MEKTRKIITIVKLVLLICCGTTFAQSNKTTDFSGAIAKYDSTFSGIGPHVYFLPPPKTKEEVLADQYEEKELEAEVVGELLNKIKYYSRLKTTGDTILVSEHIRVDSQHNESLEGKILMGIEQFGQQGKTDLAANLQNRLAMEYLKIGALDESIVFFEEALSAKAQLNHQGDRDAISYNLAILYEFANDLNRAKAIHQEVYDRALKSKNSDQQAYSMINLAIVKAKQGAFLEAERDIIRKVVPLFRRVRNDGGRVAAYSALAGIYTLQQKYPEAQWFLLQAKEIAESKKIADQMPEIIFNLAETKKYSGNNTVAIQEYKTADDLARKDNLLGMQLAIQAALGDLYHQAGDYDEAVIALHRYDTLKNRLFNGEISETN